jgi:hypothetical protein
VHQPSSADTVEEADLLDKANVAASPRDLPAGLEALDEVLLLPLRRSEVGEFTALLTRMEWHV